MLMKRPLMVALATCCIGLFYACSNPSTTNLDGFSSDELTIISFDVSPDTLVVIENEEDFTEVSFSVTAEFENEHRLVSPLFIYVEDQVTGEVYNNYEITNLALQGGTFSFNNTMTLPNAGLLELNVIMQSSAESGHNLRAEQRILAKSETNDPPVLLETIYPDTATVPIVGQNAVGFFARASDPQGANDIQGVYMDIFTKSTQSFDGQLVLLDNGNAANGDQVAGDGIYTAVVGLTPTSTPRTFELYTYVIDRQGLSSDTLKSEFTTVR